MKNQKTTTTISERVLTREEIEGVLHRIDLTPEEEIIIRMRYGIGVESDTPLAFRGTGNEELQARLALMEKSILDELEERGVELS